MGPSTAASAPARRRPSGARRRSPDCAPTASPARRRSPRSPARPSRHPRCGCRSRRAVGDRYGPRGAGFHAGLDFPAPAGTRVTAAAPGRVAFAGWDDGWGLTVTLDHGNGLRTRYAHLSRASVAPGTSVAAGTTIGRVGATGFATGPHLHFEVTIRGANADPAGAFGL